MKKHLILKILTALFLLAAALNYPILLSLLENDFYFTLQYVAAALVLAYFLSAMWSVYAAYRNRKTSFASIYIFITLSGAGLTSPVLPVPFSFVAKGLPRALSIWGLDLLILLFVIFLHITFHRKGRSIASSS